MAQTIKLKRSATSGAIPTTSSLALGEVAINTYDGKMYIKKDVGGTETVVQVGVGSVSYLEAGMIEYEYTATSNQTSFSGSDDNSATLSYIAESIMVFVNGVLQDDGVDYTASNGTSVVFGTGLAAADEVRIVAFTNVTTAANLQDPTKLDAISTVNNQAAYSLTLASSAYTPSSQNALIVSLNGITQEPGDSFTISGSTITFSPALVTGDVIDYIIDMGRAVTIGEYSGDLAVGGELEVAGDIIGDLRGSTLFKAQAGEALSKGSVVYISGISGNTTVVSKADANDVAKMPSFGVAAEAVSANNPVDIYTFGLLSGLDTSSYSEGDELFVSNTAGTLTDTPPAGESSKLQKIAKVTRSHASAGSIFIMGAGRSNAVPNLDDGDIFIGNSSNQAVTAALNTSIVPESGNLYYTDTRVDSRLASGNVGNITTTGYLRGPSTFTIDPAAHGDDTGTLVVAGNLQVDGTTTTINSTTMTVDDLNITLASGAANAAAANGAGITVDGASATLTYSSTPDAWSFNKSLGIGTDAPTEKLSVVGDINLNPESTSSADRLSTRYIGKRDSGTVGWMANIGFEGTGSNGFATDIVFNTRAGDFYNSATTEKMRITSAGNVGIGTDSPPSQLAVADSGNVQIVVKNPDAPASNKFAQFILNMGSTYFGASDKSWQLVQKGLSDGTTNFVIQGWNGSAYTTALTIAEDGNVGISQTPSQWGTYKALSINGSGTLYGTAAGATASGMSHGCYYDGSTWRYEYTGVGALRCEAVGSSAPYYTWSTANAGTADGSISFTERMRIDAAGNVGIGTTSPVSTGSTFGSVTASGSAGGEYYLATGGTAKGNLFNYTANANHVGLAAVDSSGELLFSTGGYSERMRIDSSGNVGIGNSNPAYALDVVGTLRMRQAGSELFSTIRGPGNRDLRIDLDANGDTDSFDVRDLRDSSVRFSVQAGGNVGIGTDNPTSSLQINATHPTVYLESSGGGATDAAYIQKYNNDLYIYNKEATGKLFLGTNNGTKVAIDSSGNVGIGTGTPINSANYRTIDIRGTNGGQLILGRNTNMDAFLFTESSQVIFGSGTGCDLVFKTNSTGGNNEVARFTSTGNLRLGNSTPVFIDLKSGIGTNNGGMRWRFNSDSVVYASLSLPYDTRATTGLHLYSGYPITHTVPGNKAHQFVTGGAEAARIDADGIKFNGDTAAANGLDDYEEGTWTPNCTTRSGAFTVYNATYTRIGQQVTVQGYFDWVSNNQNNNGNQFFLGGLPYDLAGGAAYTTGSIGYSGGVDITDWYLVALPGTDNFYFTKKTVAANVTNSEMHSKGLRILIISITYITDE